MQLLLLALVNIVVSHRTYQNFGVLVPYFTSSGDVFYEGAQNLAAIVMAINEINNNSILLPTTEIQFAIKSDVDNNFLTTVEDTLALIKSSFNGTGAVGIVGPFYDSSSLVSARTVTSSENPVFQVSYHATDVTLSDGYLYRYFAKTSLSAAFEGWAVAHAVYYHGWKNVIVFVSSDSYGTFSLQEFVQASNSFGINVMNKYTMWPGLTDYTSYFPDVVLGGGVQNVFILLMSSSIDCGLIIEQGYEYELFHKGVQIIGGSCLSTHDAWSSMSSMTDVVNVMKGVISVIPTVNYNTTTFANFVNRWRAQKPTKIVRQNGKVVCDSAKDADGNFIYQVIPPNSTEYECAGLNFQAFSESGGDISVSALYAYDAVWAMAYALHEVIYHLQMSSYTSDDLYQVLLTDVMFEGVSGYFNLSENGIGRMEFGRGDRHTGITYKVINFDPYYYCQESEMVNDALRTLYIWDNELGILPCDDLIDTKCSKKIIFNTVDGLPSIDVAAQIEVQLSVNAKNGLFAISIIGLFLMVYLFREIFRNRNNRLIKAAQPEMLLTIILGVALAFLKTIIATLDISYHSCLAGIWLGHIAFVIVFGAMILKTWRVNKLMRSGLKKRKITVRHVQLIAASILMFFCILLFIHTILSKTHQTYETRYNTDRTIAYHLVKCGIDDKRFAVVIYIFEAVLLFYGTWQCFSSKDVPQAVNDTNYVAMSIYLCAFICAMTFPIVYISLDPTPANLTIVMATGFITAAFGCMAVIFGPKLYLIYSGAKVDENFGIIRDSSNGSKQTYANKIMSKARSLAKGSTGSQMPSGGGGGYPPVGNHNNNNEDDGIPVPSSRWYEMSDKSHSQIAYSHHRHNDISKMDEDNDINKSTNSKVTRQHIGVELFLNTTTNNRKKSSPTAINFNSDTNTFLRNNK